MLTQTFQSVPLPYQKRAERASWPGPEYSTGIPEPYMETLNHVNGIFTAKAPSLTAATSIFVSISVFAKYWPSWGFSFLKFDSTTGQFIKRYDIASTLGSVFVFGFGALQTRLGKTFFKHYYGNSLTEFTLGALATSPPGDEPDHGAAFTIGASLPDTHFIGITGGFLGATAIDDSPGANSFLACNGWVMQVFTYSTGILRYSITMPDLIVALTLEDANRVYILLANRVLVLFDYTRNEVLGAVKIPPTIGGGAIWNNPTIVCIAWDMFYRRLLISEKVDNGPSGESRTVIRGYRIVPVPTRMTPPIPLQAPRQGRIIQVMTQVLGDQNEGVGGYLVETLVLGSGSLVGVPITNQGGTTYIRVACEGNRFYAPSPSDFDYFTTGSPDADPPHMGLIEVFCSAKTYIPEPPVSGGFPPIDTPGAPTGGGGGDTGFSLEAPNMTYILQQVLATRLWNLAESNDLGPAGRGQFIEAAVNAMHDVDAHWGFVRSTGHNYNGHAVDAVNFIRADGISAEIYDCISGSGTGGIGWGFAPGGPETMSTLQSDFGRWRYPA